ncbi:MAG: ATP-grasp domain-containing protein [Lachnospiraceae bacterium]|nr:ATP-grasp domain-containing protein [Lachnospiraceae bacterium]
MIKFLITAIGGDIGYGIIKALKARNRSIYIVGCDVIRYNMSYDLVDEFLISPAYKDEDKWIEFVNDTILTKQIDYFWPVTETELKIVDKNRNLFASTTVVMNSHNILQIATDKMLTAKFLSENGVMAPKTWDDVETCEKNFPVIVKEKFSCGSHSVHVVNDEDNLRAMFAGMDDPIVQEYIGDNSEEYTLAIFSDGKIINYIAFKRQLGFGGMSRYVELIHDIEIKKIAEKIAVTFDLHGSINVQMRKHGGDYYVFEINPRISSTIGFRLQLGFNDVSWWIDMFEGIETVPYICPEEKIFGVRSVEEKIFYEDRKE